MYCKALYNLDLIKLTLQNEVIFVSRLEEGVTQLVVKVIMQTCDRLNACQVGV